MKKYNSRDITDRFIQVFERDKPFTPSQKRMMGIQLSQLRKSVKQYIEDNNIETNLPVNNIIMDAIEYSSMAGCNFRSIASLGYDVLGESIEYWEKRRKLLKGREEKENKDDLELSADHNDVKVVNKAAKNNNKTPKWMNVEEW